MSALDVFLAITGAGVTTLVITGMVLLKPHHLVSPAPQTDLSDIRPHQLTRPNINTPTAAQPNAKQSRQDPATTRANLTEQDRPADDRQTREPTMQA